MTVFVGDDWADDHHDVEVTDDQGQQLAQARLDNDMSGVQRLHALIAAGLDERADLDPETGELRAGAVVVGIETDRGPWVQALLAAGYVVYAINPMQAARYRERTVGSGAKSDLTDAHVLARIVRLDRAEHRQIAGDSAQIAAIGTGARAHQSLVWDRTRHLNRLQAVLKDFYPAALQALKAAKLDVDCPAALAFLRAAPTPAAGRDLAVEQLELILAAGRHRQVAARAAVMGEVLRRPALSVSVPLAEVDAAIAGGLVAIVETLQEQISGLQGVVGGHFGRHPQAQIYLSQPGLGPVLAARMLGEFGDDPRRYSSHRARRNYAGTSPITRASGKRSGSRALVSARHARNRHLATATHQQAFCALTASPGAFAYYRAGRARGQDHNAALRQLANRLIGILHGCLAHGTCYDESTAWPALKNPDQPATPARISAA